MREELGGFFFYTGYKQVGCDNELTEKAKALGKYVVVIVRSDTKHHPFHYGADYIANSPEDACQHLKDKFGIKQW